MKKLQNNFTTPERSKRLLELGVPAWTADGLQTYRGIRILEEPQYNNPSPCWSVGRLMEIYLRCKNEYAFGLHFSTSDDWDEDIINDLCNLFAVAVRCKYVDFSKLEE